jgi:serpin B
VLTNAIYFNAAWEYPFSEKATQDGAFYLLDGTKVTASMMKQGENYKYTAGNGYQMVELPYVGGLMAMDILMPDAGQFAAFERSLNSQLVQEITAKLTSTKVNLIMPKFEFDSEFAVGDMLKAMGMPLALSPVADFSGMTGKLELYISEVVHKAFISVDEKGTAAAAASAVIMVGAAPVTPVAVTIDHPFIFFIRDIPTGAFLFAGRVMNPLA